MVEKRWSNQSKRKRKAESHILDERWREISFELHTIKKKVQKQGKTMLGAE